MSAGAAPCTPIMDELGDRAYAACVPLNVTLELTLGCNVRCTHCYNFDRGGPRPSGAPELGVEEIRRLFGELRRAGTLFLSLTGGEAMTHPRFWEIMGEAAAHSFAVTLLSNGTLLSRDACDRLASFRNLWGVSLSLYGAREETYAAVTRSRGSYERTIAGARTLRERGVQVWLKIIVLKENAGDVEAMVAFAEREDFDYTVDTTITGRYDGTSGSLSDRVDLKTLGTLYRGPLRHLLGKRPDNPSDDEFKCNCARGNAAISATGDVYPCIAAPLRAGSIRERSFFEIWEKSPTFHWIRGLKISDFETCAPCPLKAWCLRSPGAAYVGTGDYTGVDPWTCEEAALIRSVKG